MIDPLVAQILTAQVSFTAGINDRVIDSLKSQIRDLEAWKEIVLFRVYELCDQPWSPNPYAIQHALLVSREEIEAWIAARREDE